MTKNILKSPVEKYYLDRTDRKLIYSPTEKIPVIQVSNFPKLGKLTACRFLEWVQNNKGGVISLPTGKTPEHFIKWVGFYLNSWSKKEVKEELQSMGLDPTVKPDISSLHFIQIDEFYPIDSSQQNSFYYYIQKFYIRNLGLDPKKALLININDIETSENLPLDVIFPNQTVDLSLRTRWAKTRLERLQKETISLVDQFCTEYEKKIRGMGGIGFFLGGIGPDGHIGFNIQGSDHFSTTRLAHTNYETQAAAATDLGGIEIAKNRLVITIGLDTITFNKDAVAIIIAAGEAKSRIVSESIQTERSNRYPASVLQKLPNARFYLTEGAAIKLKERRYEDFTNAEKLTDQQIVKAVISLSCSLHKQISELTKDDYQSDRFASKILDKSGLSVTELNKRVRDSILLKIDKGMKEVTSQVFMHTAPHHDDIMLGFLPYIIHLVRTPLNRHYFNYMTSGFTAVTNSYILDLIQNLKKAIKSDNFSSLIQQQYFDPNLCEGRKRDVNLFLDGIAYHSKTLRSEAESRRLLRDFIEIYEETSPKHLEDRIDELINYFKTQYPGKKDISYVQKLKGMIREWEADLIWSYFGINVENVNHMRLGFYQGDIFTEEPEMNRDVMPIYNMIKRIKPTVISVALDPEGSGPDTHYKVLQAITEALKMYQKESDISDIKIWGYRNVWYRFDPSDANIYIPVSLNSMAILENAFMYCFGSQKSASFPSYEFDGPFCRLAQKIQVEQYLKIKTCLGRNFFVSNEHPRLRATHGLVLIKELSLEEFYKHSSEIRKSTENI